VTVFTKRNALVGFLTLEALKRRSRAKRIRRKAPKIALVSLVGLASLAAVVGIFAVLHKRRGEDDFAGLGEEGGSQLAGADVTPSSEAELDDLTAE
jgi:hypothetical protein